MQGFKSILEWWRLLGATVWQLPLAATVLTLPFTKWSLTIDGWLKALPPRWLTVLALALLVSIFFSITFYLKLKSERSNKLTLKCGIYWDKDKNPYCPQCQKPVSYNPNYFTGVKDLKGTILRSAGCFCKNCDHIYPISDEKGYQVKPEDVFKPCKNAKRNTPKPN